MMKYTITFAAILAVASAQFAGRARPPSPPTPPRPAATAANRISSSDSAANIIRYDNNIDPDGNYNYAFETDNGIAAEARGTPRDFGGNPPVIPDVAQGAFSWIAPDGQRIDITYIADENGYQPSGAAIPTPPPIPQDIARALDYLAKLPPQK